MPEDEFPPKPSHPDLLDLRVASAAAFQFTPAASVTGTFPLDPADADVAGGAACVAPTKHRVILAPDPTLDVRWAAVAWTWTLRSACFDAAAFAQFTKDHYAKMEENFVFTQK